MQVGRHQHGSVRPGSVGRGRAGRFPVGRAVSIVALAALAGTASAGGLGEDPGASAAATARLAPPPDIDLNTINGVDFSGLRLPLDPVAGPISLRATRAWTWVEEERTTFSGAEDAPVVRLVLEGDVRIRLGFYEFAAARAAVWMQEVAGKPGERLRQVFVYLDRAETPDADAAISFFAERLPVRAMIDLEGDLQLQADVVRPGRPSMALVNEGEAALAKSIKLWLSGEEEEPTSPLGQGELPPPGVLEGLAPAERYEPIFAKTGIITVAPGDVTIVSGEQENSVILTGGVTVQYSDLARNRDLRLSAQRAVIFLPSGPLTDLGRLDVRNVRGIYLEGDVVATDGKYTLRGPRVYYDVQNNRAMVVDAVFWTYDSHRGLPFYLRAETIRQESANEFSAKRARITTTAFFDPELSIGSSSLTLRRVPRVDPAATSGPPGQFAVENGAQGGYASGMAGGSLPAGSPYAASTGPDNAGVTARGFVQGGGGTPGDMRNLLIADDITLRAGGIPFLYWPGFEGDPEQIPLRDVRIENSSGSGAALKTTWNAYGLLGLTRREGLDAEIMIDAYFERGIALGTDLAWRQYDRHGSVFGYLVPYDTGTDVYTTGRETDRDGETRGIFLGDQIEQIDDNWKLVTEGSYISDESFIDAYFEDMGRSHREFTSRMNVNYTDENSYLSLEGKGHANDFIANEYLLQTPGYVTSRTPEGQYIRVFDDPIGNDDPEQPGPILWTHEYRAGRLELQFDEPHADERGFDTDSLAERAFGIGRTQSIAERLRAQGYFEDGIYRADTRQQLDMPLEVGRVNITPYTVGRATFWDNDFTQYSPGEEDNTRFWYGAGVRASTSVQRIDEGVDSRLFDLHRMRHIVTPYANFWQSGTNIDRVDLPVYDEGVEGIAEGGLAHMGVEQVWQTQRGKAGKWHSVDVFKLNVSHTTSSRDSDRESPIGRFIDYRPELSNVGNFFTADGVWQVSDALALSGATVYDTDIGQQARSSLGMIVQHAPDFSSFIEMRALNAEDATNLGFGQAYTFNRKYRVAWTGTYETNSGEFENVAAEVQRNFPTAEFGFGISYNNITGETSFGFVFRPAAAAGKSARLQGLGSSSNSRGQSW